MHRRSTVKAMRPDKIARFFFNEVAYTVMAVLTKQV